MAEHMRGPSLGGWSARLLTYSIAESRFDMKGLSPRVLLVRCSSTVLRW